MAEIPNASNRGTPAEAIQRVVEDCQRRLSTGEAYSEQATIEAHPELMPELAEALRRLRLVFQARQQAELPGKDFSDDQFGETLEPGIKLLELDGLQIRCPHCRNPVELLADIPLTDITCDACGSHFSILGSDTQTRHAVPLKTIGHFELVSRLGVGGFGTVWKARDLELDRTVAVKIPRRGQLDVQQEQQFFHEARVAAQLKHPNIVSVHEVGREDDTIYIVSDLIRGISLSHWLTGKRPTFRRAAELCVKVADALHYAHQAGIVHRDLKPSNIMLDADGEPHIMDFGLAKRNVGEITMTLDGQVLGTPAYMSPEQAGGKAHQSDGRSDIYSLGVVLFQLLTDELPFRGDVQMLIHQVLHEEVPRPRGLNSHVPWDLETICLKCLEKEPAKRYDSAKALAGDLRRHLRNEPIRARPISAWERGRRWCKRKPMTATVVGLVVLIAIVGPLVALHERWQRQDIERLHGERERLIRQLSAERDVLGQERDLLRKRLDQVDRRLPGNQPLREKMLRMAGDHYRPYVSELTNDSSREERAYAYMGLAIIEKGLYESAEAEVHFEKARGLLEEKVKEDPAATHMRAALADCLLFLSQVQDAADKPEEALENAVQARQHLAQLASDHPSVGSRKALVESYVALASLQNKFGDAMVALDTLTKAGQMVDGSAIEWPEDPRQLFLVACTLADCQPSAFVGFPPADELPAEQD